MTSTRISRGLAALVLLAALAQPAFAQDPNEIPPPPLPTREEPGLAQKTGDLLLSRPLSAVRLVAGVVALPIAWPVAALLGDGGWALDVCLVEPYEYLVERPLGRL